jgi:hypothetical protein
MATQASICNMALTHIGAKNLIANLETDSSNEAKQCRIFYAEAVRFVLSQVDWGFATARAALAQLAETSPDDWDYVYSFPADCIKFREIYTGARRLGVERVAFEVGLNATRTTKTIFTDQYQALGRYTADVINPSLFPSPFSMMVSYHLASLICYALTKKASVVDAMEKQYQKHKLIAEVVDIEESLQDPIPESEFITGR